MAAFKASARSLDQGIGAVLDALHDLDIVDNTLVLCTTDHGIAFPGAKATLFDRGIGVMQLLTRGPAQNPPVEGDRCPVSHLDVYPAPSAKACPASSTSLPCRASSPYRRWSAPATPSACTRLSSTKNHSPRRATCHRAATRHPQRWNTSEGSTIKLPPILANCDDSESKDVLVEAGWGEQLVPEAAVHDLSALDPAEGTNLIAELQPMARLAKSCELARAGPDA